MRPLLIASLLSPAAAQDADFFRREVRPILSDHCAACHGFDEAERKAGLRLDEHEGALSVIVPGDPDASELIRRVTHQDTSERMPPEEFHKPLSEGEIDALRKWISAGAPWEEHWSFVAPNRPEVPQAGTGWAKGEIDQFLARSQRVLGLSPNAEADKETLLRRVSYDLTGLPPTPAELDAFLADDQPGAYERQVDRLLDSPRYGEHMARQWLDLARYADTHGLHLDNERTMWPYRDWVVEAYQKNQPFDEFTIEQLAGDLLPDPTQDQLIASGFNRCNPTSAEGGMIAAEFLAIYAWDRVDTTATAWMGLTMACAKCHDHKYDPISTREYYEMFAFFNSLTEEASDRNIRNPVPFLRVAGEEEQAHMDSLEERIAHLEDEIASPMPEVDAAQAEWEAQWLARLEDRWSILVPTSATTSTDSELSIQSDDSVVARGANPAKDTYEIRSFADAESITALRLEALTGDGRNVPGRAHNQNFVLTGFEVVAHPAGQPDQEQPVPLRAAYASHSQEKYPVTGALDGQPGTGWAGLGANGDRSAIFVPEQPFGFEGGTVILVRLKHESQFAQHGLERVRLSITGDHAFQSSSLGNWQWSGILDTPDPRADFAKAFAPESPDFDGWEDRDDEDGKTHLFAVQPGVVYLRRTLTSPTARTLTIGLGSDDAIRAWLNGKLVHDNNTARAVAVDQDTVELPLVAGENELLLKIINFGGGFGYAFNVLAEDQGLPASVSVLLSTTERTPDQAQVVQRHFRERHAPAWIALVDERDALRTERTSYENGLPTTLISRELDTPRDAHVLTRGSYMTPGDKVARALPAVLPAMPEGATSDRLGLARWLVSGEHPLTARVTVNRMWQQLFGTGLVKTTEDFGTQGEYPVHPELLDWLAVEFVDSGWDVKGMLRRMVTSAAYRQSSAVTEAKWNADPFNRQLARGPRFRLGAEEIRDTALYVSGLLIEDRGGPPVRPYQPDGVWFAVGYSGSNTVRYSQDAGEALWRRSLYTFWKRTAPPPNMVAFDAPSREACTVERSRTVSPQQALVLWNDPTFVEAARHLAAKVMKHEGEDADRVRFAYRLVVGKAPSEAQLAALVKGLATQRDIYSADPAAANELLAIGDSEPIAGFDPTEHAAWTNLASVLLALPQTVTRG